MRTKKVTVKAKTPAKKEPINAFPLAEIFPRDIRMLKVKDIRRGYSKLIAEFLRGNVKSEVARTCAYLFSTYLQIVNQTEFEERLNNIEGKLNK